MQTLCDDFRGVLSRRIDQAKPDEIMAIAATLSALEQVPTQPQIIVAGAAVRLAQRFERRDNMIRDNVQGKIYTRANVSTERLNWQQAQKACADLRLGGHSDWRLPTIQELLSLVDYDRHDPAIDPIFECKSDWYWSSTPDHESPSGCAWLVGFGFGYSYRDGQYGGGWVRAVRVGQ